MMGSGGLLEDVVCLSKCPGEVLGYVAIRECVALPEADLLLSDPRKKAQLCNVLAFGGRGGELLDGHDELYSSRAAPLVGVLELLYFSPVAEEFQQILMLRGRDRWLGLRVSHGGLMLKRSFTQQCQNSVLA